MPWVKAGTSGFIAALVMVLLMQGAMAQGMAPFSMAPSAALLATLGLPAQPLAVILHFGYGMFWSLVLLAIFWDRTRVGTGIGLSLFLWLVMMLVLSPVIGWGVFGMNPSADLPDRLRLTSGLHYAGSTLLLHLIYGAIIGWMNGTWITFGGDVAEEIREASRQDDILAEEDGET